MTIYNDVQNPALFQVSPDPWITSSQVDTNTLKIEFDRVTQYFTIHNKETETTELYVAVTENGFNSGNYFSLKPDRSYSGNMRLNSLFLKSSAGTCTFQIIAGLTVCNTDNFWTITGSNGANQTGWQGVG